MCLKKQSYTPEQEKQLGIEVARLNSGRQATKRLKQRIVDSFFCLLIDHTNKPIKAKAILTSFGINSVSIFVPEYDLMREIYWKKEMKIKRVDFDEKDRNFMVVQFEDPKNRSRIVRWRAEVPENVSLEAQHGRGGDRLYYQLSAGDGLPFLRGCRRETLPHRGLQVIDQLHCMRLVRKRSEKASKINRRGRPPSASLSAARCWTRNPRTSFGTAG